MSLITVEYLGIVYKRWGSIKYNYSCVSTQVAVTMQQKFKSYFPYSY